MELVAELPVGIAVLGDRDPRQAGFPFVEMIGRALDPVGALIQALDQTLHLTERARPTGRGRLRGILRRAAGQVGALAHDAAATCRRSDSRSVCASDRFRAPPADRGRCRQPRRTSSRSERHRRRTRSPGPRGSSAARPDSARSSVRACRAGGDRGELPLDPAADWNRAAVPHRCGPRCTLDDPCRRKRCGDERGNPGPCARTHRLRGRHGAGLTDPTSQRSPRPGRAPLVRHDLGQRVLALRGEMLLALLPMPERRRAARGPGNRVNHRAVRQGHVRLAHTAVREQGIDERIAAVADVSRTGEPA